MISVMSEAIAVIQNRSEYGPPSKHFSDVAAMWSVILGQEVEPRKVPLMMAALKICRESENHKRDNLVDMAGYAHLAQVVAEEKENVGKRIKESCEGSFVQGIRAIVGGESFNGPGHT